MLDVVHGVRASMPKGRLIEDLGASSARPFVIAGTILVAATQTANRKVRIKGIPAVGSHYTRHQNSRRMHGLESCEKNRQHARNVRSAESRRRSGKIPQQFEHQRVGSVPSAAS